MAAEIIVIAFDSKEREKPCKRRSDQRSGFYKGAVIMDTLAFLKNCLFKEPEDFQNFPRMNGHSNDELFGLVEPLIRK